MNKKKSLISLITRVFYAAGVIFLVTGLLLSAISTSVLASSEIPLLDIPIKITETATPGLSETQISKNCHCPPQTATPKATCTETQPTSTVTAKTKTVTPKPTFTETQPMATVTADIPSATPTTTETQPTVTVTAITKTPTVTETPDVTITQTATSEPTTTKTPSVTITLISDPRPSLTPTETSVATQIATLPAPEVIIASTPILIPVTGVDLSQQIGASGLALVGGLLTKVSLVNLGVALALTWTNRQMKG